MIDTGFLHACALVSGKVLCWGDNAYGQIGTNTALTRSLIPLEVAGITDATAISLGAWHTCALLSTGETKCWGYNSSGQLGDATNTNRSSPVTVTGLAS